MVGRFHSTAILCTNVHPSSYWRTCSFLVFHLAASRETAEAGQLGLSIRSASRLTYGKLLTELMSELASLTKYDGVAVITVNNPPVNALSPGVPEAIRAHIEAAERDPSVEAVVIIGGGRTFIAGADIKELQAAASGATPSAPKLHGMLRAIEDCARPNSPISSPRRELTRTDSSFRPKRFTVRARSRSGDAMRAASAQHKMATAAKIGA